jgi:hypothetical protein
MDSAGLVFQIFPVGRAHVGVRYLHNRIATATCAECHSDK